MKRYLLAAVVLAALCYQPIVHFTTKTQVHHQRVLKTERITSPEGSRYLIFAERETFANEDSWLALKFNSSDVYGRIKDGQTCSFTVTGLRFPLFSWYRNILSASCT